MALLEETLKKPNPCFGLKCGICRKLFNHNYEYNEYCPLSAYLEKIYMKHGTIGANGGEYRDKFIELIVWNSEHKKEQLEKFLQE